MIEFRSRVNLGNDRTQLLLQKNAVITARNDLNLVMGRDPKTELNIKPELALKPAYTNLNELVETAFDKNPDLKKANQDMISSDIGVSNSIGVLYPQIGASFTYSRNNNEFERVYSDYNQNWNITYGVQLSLNLFNGMRD